MAKHRLEQPDRGKVAKKAVIAGSITLGSLAAAAGPALAAPVHIPHVGTFELPGVDTKQIPAQFQGHATKPIKKKKKSPSATIDIPNVGRFTIPGLSDSQIPPQLRRLHGRRSPLAPRESIGQKVVAAAETKIGSPYSYGSAGPDAFDCSGLVYWAYKQVGKTIPRDSYGQLGGGTPVSLENAKPGDVLIFNGGSHAGLYIGHGWFIHASTYGVPVKKDVVKNWQLTGVRRY
ncbi:MAG: C40 family peptidase [Gordonia sp. (in: high G+C Gram-positive bacteria)]